MYTESCPHCGNIVSGVFSPSQTRKILTSIAKKGGMKAVMAYVGTVFPFIGNIAGFFVGAGIDLLYGKDISKFIDKIADEIDDNKVYLFSCPQCGHEWSRKEEDLICDNYEEEDYEDEEEEDDEEMASQFDESLSYLLNETDKVIQSENSVQTFMTEMHRYALESSENLSAAFHFLAAFAGLLFIKDGDSDEEELEVIADFARNQIHKAVSKRPIDEYKLIDRLLRIQLSYNIDDLLENIRIVKAFKVSGDSWLRAEYYQKSLVPDICFFKIVDIDRDKSVSNVDKVNLWKTLVNSPVNDFRMYANLQAYMRRSEEGTTADKFLCDAYNTKGFSLNKPDMDNPMYVQWLYAALDYSEKLRAGNSEIISKNVAKGMEMLHIISNLGVKSPCLFARYSLGEIAEKEGNLQEALTYFIKAGEVGAENAIRIRKIMSSTTDEPQIVLKSENNAPSVEEAEYLEEVKACIEDGVISKGERRLLDKLRVKLGISESRATEIEASLLKPQLTEEEQEYLNEYRECLQEGGSISSGERRLLNKLRLTLGLSESRAAELEKLS